MTTPLALTREALLTVEAALARLAADRWPIRTAYRMARLLHVLREALRAFDAERAALIRDLGTPRAPTDAERVRGAVDCVYEVSLHRMTEYLARLQALRAEELAIAAAPLTLADFGPEARVSGLDLADLGPLLADDEAP